MGFKLRSSESNTGSPVQQTNLEKMRSLYNSYADNGNGGYTRTYQAENKQTHRNRSQSKELASDIYNRALRGEDSEGYAGGNSGGLFSSTKTTGGTSARSTGFSDNYNPNITEKEIFKTLNKFGSAEVVDGNIIGKNTHTETNTINEKQYNRLGANLARGENLLLAKNKKKKALELRKQQNLSAIETKRNNLLTAKAEKKKAIELKRQQNLSATETRRNKSLAAKAERKKAIELKRQQQKAAIEAKRNNKNK